MKSSDPSQATTDTEDPGQHQLAVSSRVEGQMQNKPRTLNLYKCYCCRRDKRECLPIDRKYTDMCDRCIENKYICSEPIKTDPYRIGTDKDNSTTANDQFSATNASTTGSGNPGGAPPMPAKTENRGLKSSSCDNPPALVFEGERRSDQGNPHQLAQSSTARSISSRLINPETSQAVHGGNRAVLQADGDGGSGVNPETELLNHVALPEKTNPKAANRTELGKRKRTESGGYYKIRRNRSLACPFYKFDSVKYYCCIHHQFATLSDVRQHLKLRHTLNYKRHCSRCWSKFETAEMLKEHRAKNDCNAIPEPEELDEPELLELFSMPRTLDDEDLWNWMWGKLFPGYDLPLSAYVENGITEPFRTIFHNSQAALLTMLPSMLESLNIHVDAEVIPKVVSGILNICASSSCTPLERHRRHPS